MSSHRISRYWIAIKDDEGKPLKWSYASTRRKAEQRFEIEVRVWGDQPGVQIELWDHALNQPVQCITVPVPPKWVEEEEMSDE